MNRLKIVGQSAIAVLVALMVACVAHKDVPTKDDQPPPLSGHTTSPGQPEREREPAQPQPQTEKPDGRNERVDRKSARRHDDVPRAVNSPQELSKDAATRQAANTSSIAVVSLKHHEVEQLMAPATTCCIPDQQQNTENYQTIQDNPLHRTAEQPVSTFSIDVDTGSYANVRRLLNAGMLPPQDAVRVEELLNYFDYDYPAPISRDTPFRVSTELAATPWNRDTQLLRIGIKGYTVPSAQRPPANLVFLIDVSGSMQSPYKLPLLKNAFRLLTQQLSARDRVAMVVYAGASGVVLEPTAGDRKQRILDALGALDAGGSTNGGAGIELAYRMARDAFIKGGINRVILATDGDFNVGTVNFDALVDIAERERASGVALTTLGFGTGNYNEKLLERLADAGNGNYAYVDTVSEARKILVEELSSTLLTIARDVKIQVEFNPAVVAEYRLIGYENRVLAREDFNNDKVDAGDIGAGHRVTALYEVLPAGNRGRIDPLRYGGGHAERNADRGRQSGELAFVRLRYKRPDMSEASRSHRNDDDHDHGHNAGRGDSDASRLIEFPVMASTLLPAGRESADFRFAASVAAFGQILRGGKYTGTFTYDNVRSLASPTVGADKQGYRREFLALVDLAAALQPALSNGTENDREHDGPHER